ncbi:hypothetical protein ACFXPN_17965 [Streptomyces griseorubiginosus]|uniref:hypothetical protein n=1 Tax=Streptomyces griseorubiginosus TaxID=67304 RepID=UPI0036A341F9
MALRHPDGEYAITAMYSVPDDAWYLELDQVAGQRNLVTAIVQVDGEIRTSRAWMRLRPELVEIIHDLRQEYMGFIDDDAFPSVLAELRATVSEADLPTVLKAAFGRGPDGNTMDGPPEPEPEPEPERQPVAGRTEPP